MVSGLTLASGTTLAASPPAVTGGTATSITDNGATFGATVNPNGQATTYAFQFGPTTNYGMQTTSTSAGSGTTDQAVEQTLTRLTPGTLYHFRVIATNASGNVFGQDQTFTTTGTRPTPPQAPTVTTGASTTGVGTANLTGTVNPNGSAVQYYFQYGPTADYGVQTTARDLPAGTAPVAVSTALSGLQQGATYHYRLVAVGPDNTVTTGADATFTVGGQSTLSFFGKDAFADQHGVGAIFLGNFSNTAARGTNLTLSRSGRTLGVRAAFTIKANTGGFVHYTLNSLGQSLLKSRHSLRVSVSATTATGARITTVITVQQFTAA